MAALQAAAAAAAAAWWPGEMTPSVTSESQCDGAVWQLHLGGREGHDKVGAA